MTWEWQGEELRHVRAAVEGLARKIAGEWFGAEHAERVPTRFFSVGHALRWYLVVAIDGYSLAPIGDPDRLYKLVHAPGVPSSNREPSTIRDANDFLTIGNALDSTTDDVTATTIVLARYAAQMTPLEISERLFVDGVALTPKAIGKTTRNAYAALHAQLVDAELVPVKGSESMEDDRPNPLTDSDLFGWEEISRVLRVSVSTAKRWARSHGLPIKRFTVGGDRARVEASTDDLRQWRQERTTEAIVGEFVEPDID